MTNFTRLPAKRLESIQALRAFAALAVVTFHALGLVTQSGWHVGPQVGAFGVDVFFVISGFVMVLTTQNRPAPGKFMTDRLARIVPLYWAATTAKVILMLALPAVGALKFNTAHVLASYAFVPWRDPTGAMYPIVYVGWTLTYELWFYAAFAAVGLRADRLALLFGALVAVGSIFPTPPTIGFLTDPVLLEFVSGCFIGLVFTQQRWAIAAATACIALALPQTRAFYWGVPAAVLVAGCLALEPWWPRTLLSRIGDSSYALYLSHIFVLPVVCRVAVKFVPHAPGGAIVAVAIAVAVTVGHAVHLAIEQPLAAIVRRYRKGAVDIDRVRRRNVD